MNVSLSPNYRDIQRAFGLLGKKKGRLSVAIALTKTQVRVKEQVKRTSSKELAERIRLRWATNRSLSSRVYYYQTRNTRIPKRYAKPPTLAPEQKRRIAQDNRRRGIPKTHARRKPRPTGHKLGLQRSKDRKSPRAILNEPKSFTATVLNQTGGEVDAIFQRVSAARLPIHRRVRLIDIPRLTLEQVATPIIHEQFPRELHKSVLIGLDKGGAR